MCGGALRIDVDYKEPHGGFRPAKITYVWHEDGQQKTHVHVATRPRETYTINCGPKTVVHSFSVELADEFDQPQGAGVSGLIWFLLHVD